MPTAKPRIQVTLTTPQFDLLRRLSKLQHRSMSAIVAELWESIHPVLERVAVVLQAAVRAQESAKEGLTRSVMQSERELRPHIAAALGQLDLLTMEFEDAAKPPEAAADPRSGAGAASVPTPVLVTRGSGRRTLHRSKARPHTRKRPKSSRGRAKR